MDMKSEREIRKAILEADRIRVLEIDQLGSIVGGVPPASTTLIAVCGENHTSMSTCTRIDTETSPLTA
jgi:hypothetical protein